jgi:hypothetical protein
VVDLLPGATTEPPGRRLLGRLGGRRTAAIRMQPEPPEVRTTPAADFSLAGATSLAGTGPLGSHHLLLAALDDPNTAVSRTLTALGIDLDRTREALRTADVTGTSDELPEEAGRRQMVITVTDDRVTLEASDAEIIKLGRAALRTSASTTAEPGGPTAESSDSGSSAEPSSAEPSSAEPSSAALVVVRGDHPLSGSLSFVWQALHDSLEDIRHRAAAEARDTRARAAGESPTEPPEEAAGG